MMRTKKIINTLLPSALIYVGLGMLTTNIAIAADDTATPEEDNEAAIEAEPSKKPGWLPSAPTAKLPLSEEYKTVYVGGGIFGELIHATAEIPFGYGNVYVKVGQFYDGDTVTGQLGFHIPYKFSDKVNHRNGVYLGSYVGGVEPDSPGGERKDRLGLGFDVAYVWQDPDRISTLAVSVYFAEKLSVNGDVHEPKPDVAVSYNLSVGAF